MKKLLLCVSMLAGGLQAATECVWIGGTEGNFSKTTNWSNEKVPTGISSDYVAVFTNSVTLTLDMSWYSVGIIVSNNSEVVVNRSSDSERCYPSRKCENNAMTIDVEDGSMLTVNAFFFSLDARSLIKKGGGTFYPAIWFGNPNSQGSYWTSVDVQEGILKLPTTGRADITNTLHICSGATALLSGDNPFGSREEEDEKRPYRFSQPKVEIDAGGVFDMNGKSAMIASLAGAGNVANCVKNLKLLLRDSGCVFSGKIDGGGWLYISPTNIWTALDATWTVGSADTLRGVELKREQSIGCNYEVKFTSGIETFYARLVPTDMPSFNTDGAPVEIARSGKFWYVDCKREGEAGDGKSLDTAFQTLKEAMGEAKAGDTVWVASGVYSNDTMLSGTVSYNRMIVPANVRVISLEGADNTVITGDNSPEPIADGYGCGPEAVRCVMMGENSMLRGFTLRGGRTYAENKSDHGDSSIGGGIYADTTSVIIDCVISNCVSGRGGGAYRGNYFNCRFDSNRALESEYVGAHLYSYANLYNCVLRGGLSGCHWYVNNSGMKVVNCTFDYNSKGGIRSLNADENALTGIFNSLIFGKPFNPIPGEYSNCIISPKGELPADDDSVVTNLTSKTSPTIYQFAGIYENTLRPKKHSSRVTGACDAEKYLSLFPVAQYWLSQYDAAWQKRIWDGVLDMGAYSYDHSLPIPGFIISVR